MEDMEDMEFDHLVADRLHFRLPSKLFAEYSASSVEAQVRRYLTEYVGIEIELDRQTTVLRVCEDAVVYVE